MGGGGRTGTIGLQEGCEGGVWIVLFDVLDEELEEARELRRTERDDELIAVVVEVNVVPLVLEPLDVDEPDYLFGVGRAEVVGANDEDVGEQGDKS
jgi:hypothetical protein